MESYLNRALARERQTRESITNLSLAFHLNRRPQGTTSSTVNNNAALADGSPQRVQQQRSRCRDAMIQDWCTCLGQEFTKVASLTVSICYPQEEQAIKTLPIKALAIFCLLRNKTLKTIEFCHGVCWTGSRDEFIHASHHLSRLSGLQTISLNCPWQMQVRDYFVVHAGVLVEEQPPTTTAAEAMDILLQGLNQVDSLKFLRITGGPPYFRSIRHAEDGDDEEEESPLVQLCRGSGGSSRVNFELRLVDCTPMMSNRLLQSICSSGESHDSSTSRLVKLTLVNCLSHDTNIQELARVLRNNQSLRELLISFSEPPPDNCCLNVPAVIGMLEMLEHNQTLKKLNLDAKCFPLDLDAGDTWIQIEDTIARIIYLKTLTLYFHGYSERCNLNVPTLVLRALRQNQVLIKLDITIHWTGSEEQQRAFEPLYVDECNEQLELALATNKSLQVVELSVMSPEWELTTIPLNKNIQFFLKMNRIGRKSLDQDPLDRRLWTDTLIEQKDDTALSFHLLSTNIAVFSPLLVAA